MNEDATSATLDNQQDQQVDTQVTEDQQQDDQQTDVTADTSDDTQATDDQQQDDDNEEDQSVAPISRRQSLRMQALIEQRNRAEERARMVPKTSGMDYESELNADPETVKRLQQDRDNVADQAFKEGLKRTQAIEFRTRLEVDAPRVETKYPSLDKNSPDFHPALADSVNKMYLGAVGYDPKSGTVANPDIRYADYVEAFMELADEMAATKAAKSSANISSQAANTGIRPNGGKAKSFNFNKQPKDMSDDELNAFLKANGL